MEAAAIGGAGELSRDGCADCGKPLAADQRYCLNCGKRVGALSVPGSQQATPAESGPVADAGSARPLALPFGLPPLRMPAPRSAGAVAALSLAFGVFVGLAMGPAFPGAGLATSRFVVQLPTAAEQAATGAGAASASATLGSPVGNVGSGAPAQAAPQAVPQTAITQTPAPAPEPTPNDQEPAKHNGHAPPLPPSHEKPTVQGIVVQVNPVAESYSVATTDEDHQLIAIHDEDLPDPRTRVEVRVRELFNGTYAEVGKRTENGTRGDATLDGMVTYRDAQAGVYTVSMPGSSILVHLPDGAQADELPPLNNEISLSGTVEPAPTGKAKRHRAHRRHKSATARAAASFRRAAARAAAKAADGCSDEPIPGPEPSSVLQQRSVTVEGPPVGSVNVEGIVERACASSQELGLSADGIRESGSDITLASPEDIDLSLLELGKPVDATMSIAEDGSYELTGVSSDDGVTGADDSEAGQGDQAD